MGENGVCLLEHLAGRIRTSDRYGAIRRPHLNSNHAPKRATGTFLLRVHSSSIWFAKIRDLGQKVSGTTYPSAKWEISAVHDFAEKEDREKKVE